MKVKILSMIVLALFLVITPATLAANRGESTKTQDSKEKKFQSTGEYVRDRVRLMNDPDKEKKEKAQEEAIIRLKERGNHAIQMAISRYERVRIQANNSNLTEEEKTKIEEVINAQIQSLADLRIELEATESFEETKAIIKKIRTGFKYSLGLVRQSVKGVYEDRLNNIIEKIQTSYQKISERVDSLEDSELKEALLAELSVANALIVSAQEKISAGNLVGARADLVSAREVLVSVVVKLK